MQSDTRFRHAHLAQRELDLKHIYSTMYHVKLRHAQNKQDVCQMVLEEKAREE